MQRPLITISMTAISSRLHSVTNTIKSLLDQDYGNFSVRLYLSREPFLIDMGVPGRLPLNLEDLRSASDKLTVAFVPNIGPYRKILPFLTETRGHRCLVATADDDTIYPRDWLAGLYDAYLKYRCVVCYRGHFMRRTEGKFQNYRNWMQSRLYLNPDLYNLPTGKDGVLYDTSFFDPAVLNYALALNLAPTADDLWLKWHYSAFADVAVFIINSDFAAQTFDHNVSGQSLYRNFNRDGGNDIAIERLEEYTSRKIGRSFASRL